MQGHSFTLKDENIATGDEGGPTVYGQLRPRPGNSSECQQVYNDGFRLDGTYTVQPGNESVYCNLTSLGWVVFQRRIDDSVDFYRNWNEYVNGFGDPTAEFWLGLEALHQATATGCELHIYMEAEPSNPDQDKGYAYYSSFTVGSAATNYVMIENGFVGNVGDSLAFHNGTQFTTYEVDNDNQPLFNCAARWKGGWWYHDCHLSDLNGLYFTSSFGEGVLWRDPRGLYYSLRRTEMAFRC